MNWSDALKIALGAGGYAGAVVGLLSARAARKSARETLAYAQAAKQKERNASLLTQFGGVYAIPEKGVGHKEARRRAGELYANFGASEDGRYAATVAYMRFCAPYGEHSNESRLLLSECDRVERQLAEGAPLRTRLHLVDSWAESSRNAALSAGDRPWPWLIHDARNQIAAIPRAGSAINMGRQDPVEATPAQTRRVLNVLKALVPARRRLGR
jgi:hypothetical protein